EAALDRPQLLDDVDVVDVAQRRAAVLLGEDDAEEPELTGFLERVDGEVLRLIPLRDMRFDLARGELADHVPNLLLLVSQTEIHSRSWRPEVDVAAGREPLQVRSRILTHVHTAQAGACYRSEEHT